MKKLEINKTILTRYNVLTKQATLLARNLETDAKRHPIRVGAWVDRWVAKGKGAIKSQGAYKVQNLKMPFGLRYCEENMIYQPIKNCFGRQVA